MHACWASLWSERAILSRARQNVDQASVKLAVVVQRMVPADAAGVMFTTDPVSGLRDVVLISANPGPGRSRGKRQRDPIIMWLRSVQSASRNKLQAAAR